MPEIKRAIALGFFDGVHRGHGALLQRTAERARELGAEPVVFTFDRPPKEVVTGQPVYLINSAEDRQGLIRRLYGIDRIILAPFDREMMTMSWEDFVTELLVKRCVAGPSDWVDLDESGNLYVNGTLLEEPYLTEKAFGDTNISLPYQVGDGRWFLVGDNRKISVDSRNTAVGCVAGEQIVGRIAFCIWPLSDFGLIG